MNKILKYILYIIGTLVLVGLTAFFTWFYNPYSDTLRLDPSQVYGDTTGSQGYLITNASIVDVKAGKLIRGKDLLIRNGVIEGVLSSGLSDSLTHNYQVTDATGKFILPGLFDLHTHLNSGGLVAPEESTPTSVLEQFVRYGVTTILSVGPQGFDENQTVKLKEKKDRQQIISPELFATGNVLTAPGSHPVGTVLSDMLGKPADEIDLQTEAKGIILVTPDTDLNTIIQTKKNKELDGIKVIVESGPEQWYPKPRMSAKAIQKIVDSASRYNMPVFAHVTRYEEFSDAVHAGVDGIMHSVSNKVIEDSELLDIMKRDSIFYVPTFSMFNMPGYLSNPTLLDDPFLMDKASRRATRSLENWPIRTLIQSGWDLDYKKQLRIATENMKIMHQAGIPVVMGTDAGNPTIFPGYSAHLELEFMAQAGLSNADVLRAATIHSASVLGIDQHTGSIAEGKAANLMLLNENPLDDIRNTRSINRVMLEGYWIE